MSFSTRVLPFLLLAAIATASVPTFSVPDLSAQETELPVMDTAPPQTADAATPFPRIQGATDAMEPLLAVLDQETSFDFFETPLADVVREISQLHQIPVFLDALSLKELGREPSEPITFEMNGVGLGTALRLMLEQIELTISTQDNVLLITNLENERAITRTYNVVDMLHRDQINPSIDALIEVIVRSVRPDTWDEVGGTGTISVYQGNLVISQSLRTHIEIIALLKALRHNIQQMGGPKLPVIDDVQSRQRVRGGFGGGDRRAD